MISVCPTQVLFGIDCPACGVTRGVLALAQGDVGAALSHNVLLVVVVPLGVLWGVGQLRRALGGPAVVLPTLSRRVWTAVIVVAAMFTVARNLALPGLAWLDAA